MPNSMISIKGAKEHNLKNINIDIPRHKLIVLTGVSGSGKSSLAFDTIYSEGQRRYVESLSAYARQFLDKVQKPQVEQIEGLSPAISIEQKTTNHNPRSTVGTITEIYDYLRLLFARIGIAHSPATGLPIKRQTVSEMIDIIMAIPVNTRLYLLAPCIKERKGEFKKEIADLQKKGFQRLKVNGQFYDINDVPILNKNKKHDVDVVVDRLVIQEDIQTRLSDSLETALALTDGIAVIEFADEPLIKPGKFKNETHKRITFSEKFSCPESGFTLTEIEPRLFSFNSPFGACSGCNGLGFQQKIDSNLIIDNDEKSLAEGVLIPWQSSYHQQILSSLANFYNFDLKTPWKDLPEQYKNIILHGSGEQKIPFDYSNEKIHYKNTKVFDGLITILERKWQETESPTVREDIEKFMTRVTCSCCNGYRLTKESLFIKINDRHIGQISDMSIISAYEWFTDLPQHLSDKENTIAEPIIKEITSRLKFLINVGLNYLTISRSSETLSGGESQRIRLASQIGSGLTGVLYVLDEPSIGLHQRDNEKLLITLEHLRNLGNSVLVVEHDEDAILRADQVIDIGPFAGEFGGQIIAQGTAEEIMANKESLTGQYLSGQLKIERQQKIFNFETQPKIQVFGATGNNLKDINVEIPLGVFTCITGVSGSGKSTFLIETLVKEAQKYLYNSKISSAPHKEIKGLDQIDKLIRIDQSPIGRTPRSNPATYTGIFTPIREWFAKLPESKARGYTSGRFSFNVKGGRCEACKGDGLIKIEMHFLPAVYVTCDICKGKRYNRETLEITYKNKSISDILNMTVFEAAEFFQPLNSIRRELNALERVGLGYIKLGQPSTTLSGGEAQRIKFAKELSKRATGNSLYILDEPTTGLHFHDIAKLLELLDEFVQQGNSVIIIEHNLDLIKNADWIIDFGPEGGDGGGKIIAQGTVKDIINSKLSYTGHFLKIALDRHKCTKS
ncbi:excinuclease ABC subunit UvrA [Bartonella sp. DGB1]|uniref:excinuclease ABC subunit UvrA n=1 Tax=Bartonella sp. DGB1 TaxID=3239807 RepID=UPI00352595E5